MRSDILVALVAISALISPPAEARKPRGEGQVNNDIAAELPPESAVRLLQTYGANNHGLPTGQLGGCQIDFRQVMAPAQERMVGSGVAPPQTYRWVQIQTFEHGDMLMAGNSIPVSGSGIMGDPTCALMTWEPVKTRKVARNDVYQLMPGLREAVAANPDEEYWVYLSPYHLPRPQDDAVFRLEQLITAVQSLGLNVPREFIAD